ncbi:hypothetical protein CI105_02110 [Candidatus Izimaplasma bacterium ZiA1]|uniref:FMN-binding protein n=1 Tax=Candidatus Izimoplasma sp. ZiA1 TaxID=2024899 RepID=UPI000BAA8EFF|nr:hypothetical protein CI105_02110 [Candidatus Izimaplasma bacterium ZiA1]
MLGKLKKAFVLLIIGVISGGSIYLVNELTWELIRDNQIKLEEKQYSVIFEDGVNFEATVLEGDISKKVEVYDESLNLLGYIFKGTRVNNYGRITVLVGINVDNEIEQVVIASTNNTPNNVQIIKSKYIMNFDGQSVNSEINYDAKTGASYTYASIQEVIEDSITYYLNEGGE